MATTPPNPFGSVHEDGDVYEFSISKDALGNCILRPRIRVERGRIIEPYVVTLPLRLWRKVSVRVVRELTSGMDEKERGPRKPKLLGGTNLLSPMIGRELAILLWALIEDGAEKSVEPIVQGWRELAREERWWLYSKAAAKGQETGVGWRRALFVALSQPTTSRSQYTEKKSPEDSSMEPTSSKPSTTTSEFKELAGPQRTRETKTPVSIPTSSKKEPLIYPKRKRKKQASSKKAVTRKPTSKKKPSAKKKKVTAQKKPAKAKKVPNKTRAGGETKSKASNSKKTRKKTSKPTTSKKVSPNKTKKKTTRKKA